MVTVETKDVGDVKDVYRGGCYVRSLEDLCEKYIKRNMGLEKC